VRRRSFLSAGHRGVLDCKGCMYGRRWGSDGGYGGWWCRWMLICTVLTAGKGVYRHDAEGSDDMPVGFLGVSPFVSDG